MLSPKELLSFFSTAYTAKVKTPLARLFLLAVCAGVFIALAGIGATTAMSTIENPAVAKLISAVVFPAGLTMILLAGGELFTGDCLLIIGCLSKTVRWGEMLRVLLVVYLGNLFGSLITAWLVVFSHTPSLFDGMLAVSIVNAAQAKVSLSFGDGFLRGILCNYLVCMSVWIAAGSKNAAAKIISLFYPILLFVLCGFEHCVANMYYIPAGIWTASEYGIAAEGLNWGSMFLKNLLPVTLGNIAGGSVLFGAVCWVCYRN